VLAIPSIVVGWPTIAPLLFEGWFGDAIFVLERHDVLAEVGAEFHGAAAFIGHAITHSLALYLAAAGAFTAWFLYIRRPELPALIAARLAPIHALLVNKYYFDWLNENVLAPLTRGIGNVLWNVGDRVLIDGIVVNGSAKTVAVVAGVVRRIQSGYLYTYAFMMVFGLAVLIGWFVLRS
jgi:NADH-quinone oxidoreductase subunit L